MGGTSCVCSDEPPWVSQKFSFSFTGCVLSLCGVYYGTLSRPFCFTRKILLLTVYYESRFGKSEKFIGMERRDLKYPSSDSRCFIHVVYTLVVLVLLRSKDGVEGLWFYKCCFDCVPTLRLFPSIGRYLGEEGRGTATSFVALWFLETLITCW